MSAVAARIQEADRQARWAERKEQGGTRRQYETKWLVERLRDYLPPEHVALARRIRDLAARARGVRLAAAERVDAGNGAEIALLSRLDAARALGGYSQAVVARLGSATCFHCIAEEYTLGETLQACGYANSSWRSIRKLAQLTLMAAADYADECAAQRERWRGL